MILSVFVLFKCVSDSIVGLHYWYSSVLALEISCFVTGANICSGSFHHITYNDIEHQNIIFLLKYYLPVFDVCYHSVKWSSVVLSLHLYSVIVTMLLNVQDTITLYLNYPLKVGTNIVEKNPKWQSHACWAMNSGRLVVKGICTSLCRDFSLAEH